MTHITEQLDFLSMLLDDSSGNTCMWCISLNN